MLGDWSYYVISTDLPKYIYEVLHVSIHDTGIFVSVPWILRTIIAYAFGLLVDWLIASKRMGVTNARKLAVFLGIL